MASRRLPRIVPIILVIVIIIAVVVALVSLARLLFFSGASSTPPQADTSQQELLDTSASHGVILVVRGPIVADENFRSYSITISPSSRSIQTYTGYLDAVVEQKTLPNNNAAYQEFVYALDRANLMRGTPFEGERNDIRGICATGKVSSFSLLNNGSAVKTLWTSTCNGSPGSLKASPEQLTQLFVNQIPDANQIIRRVSL